MLAAWWTYLQKCESTGSSIVNIYSTLWIHCQQHCSQKFHIVNPLPTVLWTCWQQCESTGSSIVNTYSTLSTHCQHHYAHKIHILIPLPLPTALWTYLWHCEPTNNNVQGCCPSATSCASLHCKFHELLEDVCDVGMMSCITISYLKLFVNTNPGFDHCATEGRLNQAYGNYFILENRDVCTKWYWSCMTFTHRTMIQLHRTQEPFTNGRPTFQDSEFHILKWSYLWAKISNFGSWSVSNLHKHTANSQLHQFCASCTVKLDADFASNEYLAAHSICQTFPKVPASSRKFIERSIS